MSSNNFGLNNDYDYYEYEFDSKDTSDTLDVPDTTLVTPLPQSQLVLNWPLFTIGRPNEGTISAMKILEVQIPFSFYPVNLTNNRFILTEDATALQVRFTIIIPPGQYSATLLASTIQDLMNAVTTYTASGSPTPYTVTYNTITKKFTFDLNIVTPSVPFVAQFQLVFVSALPPPFVLASANLLMGFEKTTYTSVSVPGPGATNLQIQAPFVTQVTGPDYLFINSNKMGQTLKLHLPAGAFNEGQIGPQMAKVPINVNPGGVIFWQNSDPQKWFNIDGLDTLYKIDFYCTLGNTPYHIDFNGSSFSLKLGVLINRTGKVDQQSGLTSEGRVLKRMRGSV